MKITVTTPTGRIGQALAGRLLDAGVDLTLLCRDPDKVRALTARGAKAIAGDQTDAAAVTRATEGADALFWVSPADYTAKDMRAFQNLLGRAAAAAIRSTGVARVVNLSSVGAQHPSGTGPVAGLHDIEKLIEDGAKAVTHLRPAYFFENYLFQAEAIKTAGRVFLPVSGSTRIPMVATRDVAQVAAERLLDGTWTGRSTMGAHGPAGISFDEAATAISEGLRRTVEHFTVAPGNAREAILAMGASENVADTFVEMYAGIEKGLLDPEEPRTPRTTTPTTLVTFARESLAPLVAPPAG